MKMPRGCNLYTHLILHLHGLEHRKMQRNDCYQRFLGSTKIQASATGLLWIIYKKSHRIHDIAKAIHSETDGWITKFINRNCASSCSCTAVCASRCTNKTEEVSWEQLSQQFCVSLQTLVKIYLWPLQHWTNVAVDYFLFFTDSSLQASLTN